MANADNQRRISLAKNPVFHDRSKHIDIQYHCTRDLVEQEKIQLKYIPTQDMLADVLAKSLSQVQHEPPSNGIGLF